MVFRQARFHEAHSKMLQSFFDLRSTALLDACRKACTTLLERHMSLQALAIEINRSLLKSSADLDTSNRDCKYLQQIANSASLHIQDDIVFFTSDHSVILTELQSLSPTTASAYVYRNMVDRIVDEKLSESALLLVLDDWFREEDVPPLADKWPSLQRNAALAKKWHPRDLEKRRSLGTIILYWNLDVAHEMTQIAGCLRSSEEMCLLATCARRWRCFKTQFVPRANRVLIDRQVDAIRSKKRNHVSLRDNPYLMHEDLKRLVDLAGDSRADDLELHQWVVDNAGSVLISSRRLNEWKPDFQRFLLSVNKFGLVMPRDCGGERKARTTTESGTETPKFKVTKTWRSYASEGKRVPQADYQENPDECRSPLDRRRSKTLEASHNGTIASATPHTCSLGKKRPRDSHPVSSCEAKRHIDLTQQSTGPASSFQGILTSKGKDLTDEIVTGAPGRRGDGDEATVSSQSRSSGLQLDQAWRELQLALRAAANNDAVSEATTTAIDVTRIEIQRLYDQLGVSEFAFSGQQGRETTRQETNNSGNRMYCDRSDGGSGWSEYISNIGCQPSNSSSTLRGERIQKDVADDPKRRPKSLCRTALQPPIPRRLPVSVDEVQRRVTQAQSRTAKRPQLQLSIPTPNDCTADSTDTTRKAFELHVDSMLVDDVRESSNLSNTSSMMDCNFSSRSLQHVSVRVDWGCDPKETSFSMMECQDFKTASQFFEFLETRVPAQSNHKNSAIKEVRVKALSKLPSLKILPRITRNETSGPVALRALYRKLVVLPSDKIDLEFMIHWSTDDIY